MVRFLRQVGQYLYQCAIQVADKIGSSYDVWQSGNNKPADVYFQSEDVTVYVWRQLHNASKTTHGFTLIETVVATAILTISISGLMSAVFTSSVANRQAENRTTAYYLAQEGIEYLRYSRDNAWKQENTMQDWEQQIDDKCSGNNVCRISTTDKKIRNCGSSHDDCAYLHFNASTNQYEYDSGQQTNFKRSAKVTFNDISGGSGVDEARIDITVSFGDDSSQRITVTEYVYRWAE